MFLDLGQRLSIFVHERCWGGELGDVMYDGSMENLE